MSSYRDLLSWQRAMALVTEIYVATADFPKSEIYGLTSQLRRAATSIPSNIAEGKGRNTDRDYVQFLYRARGSLLEVETQLEIARNLGYLEPSRLTQLHEECAGVGRVLNGLIASLRRQIETTE
jgi:four helix bundle protein